TSDKPTLIACKTVIGYGAPKKQGTSATHGSPLGAEEVEGARKALDWPYAPFEVPDAILKAWRAAGVRSAKTREAWENGLRKNDKCDAFQTAWSGDYAGELTMAINAYKAKLADAPQKAATRKASEMALEVVNATIAETIGGSADLTGSNNTKTKNIDILSAENYAGRYVYYGVREHGMAAAMNGMALHGGVVPYGGTFLVFTDYCRPSIRLSALMGVRVVYVMTHDSIGLGEDGPTHQPVEQLAALRAIPNLNVYRPCDTVETAECWEMALKTIATPSVLALSRQNLPQLRTSHTDENLVSRGAYVIAGHKDGDVTLIASGSEVSLAMEARELLAKDGIKARVVSAPCFELFANQPDSYRKTLLGKGPRIGIEAAVRQGWDLFLRRKDTFIGMNSFGASAPAEQLYEEFGITAAAVAKEAKRLIG
ncbi:MAG: transketolase C-terminal domain-containing protein, partial [Parvularculaceae bacterium]